MKSQKISSLKNTIYFDLFEEREVLFALSFNYIKMLCFGRMLKGRAKKFFSLSWTLLQNSHVTRCRQFTISTQHSYQCHYPQTYFYFRGVLKNPFPLCSAVRDLHSSSSTDSAEGGIQKSISALQAKKRVPRKKSMIGREQVDQETGLVVAYSSAEEYDMLRLTKELDKQGLYECLPLPEDVEEVIHVSAKYRVGKEPRHIYFFSEGSVVFWNVPQLEQQTVLRFLKQFETNSYDPELVNAEKEDLEYIYSEKGTKFSRGRISLNSVDNTALATYTFSNSLALSVKLAMWEAALENYIDSMEWVTENMKKGKQISMSRDQVFIKRGELFALRHVINLSSDLLDTPDFYWDRQELETLYQQMCNHLNIAKRTKVMNERLSYCSELIDLLGNHMNDKHHVRLEWMIIILIMVEVMFECIHFIEQIIH